MYAINSKSLQRSANRFADMLEKHGGDADAILDEERIDGHALGHLLGELAEKRGYDKDACMVPLLEAFLLGAGAGRRECLEDDVAPLDLDVTLN